MLGALDHPERYPPTNHRNVEQLFHTLYKAMGSPDTDKPTRPTGGFGNSILKPNDPFKLIGAVLVSG